MAQQEKIIEHLKIKYQPDAIILHGSRARKKNRPTSDWDIYLVMHREGLSRTSEVFEDQILDINIIQFPLKIDDWADAFGSSLEVAEVLFDPSGMAAEVMRVSKEVYSRGRALTESDYQNKKNYFDRLILRLNEYLVVPEMFFYYVGFLYEDAIRFWFELRGIWSKPVYEALPIIQTNDQEYFLQLKVLFERGTNEDRLRAAKILRAKLFVKEDTQNKAISAK